MPNTSITPRETPKLRGYIGNFFQKYDIIHNHNVQSGKPIYRYPLVQFKVVNRVSTIIAVTEKGLEIFYEIFLKLNEIDLGNRKIPLNEKEIEVEEVQFGDSDNRVRYEFNSPWIGLNQKNYLKFRSLENYKQRRKLLSGVLIGNVLSMAKYLDYTVKNRLEASLDLYPCDVNFKGKQLMGFLGRFELNFVIPQYLGIGKSVSRGFGVLKRVDGLLEKHGLTKGER